MELYLVSLFLTILFIFWFSLQLQFYNCSIFASEMLHLVIDLILYIWLFYAIMYIFVSIRISYMFFILMSISQLELTSRWLLARLIHLCRHFWWCAKNANCLFTAFENVCPLVSCIHPMKLQDCVFLLWFYFLMYIFLHGFVFGLTCITFLEVALLLIERTT